MKPPRQREIDLQRQITQVFELLLPDMLVIRVGQQPRLLACYRGWFLAFEIKRPGGKMSPAQVQFRADIKRCGGRYFLLSSVEAAEAAAKSLKQEARYIETHPGHQALMRKFAQAPTHEEFIVFDCWESVWKYKYGEQKPFAWGRWDKTTSSNCSQITGSRRSSSPFTITSSMTLTAIRV